MAQEESILKGKRKSGLRISLKRLIVQVTIKQRLDFFQNVDGIGLALEDEFEHWQRGAVFLHLRNLKKHRGLVLGSKDMLLTHHGIDLPFESYAGCASTFEPVFAALKREEIEGVRVLSTFSRAAPGDFKSVQDRISDSIATPTEPFLDVIGDISDVGHSFICHLTGCVVQVSVGPVRREEWFKRVDYEINDPASRLFGTAESLEEFRKEIPEVLYFTEVTSAYQKVVPKTFATIMQQSGDRAMKIADGIGALLNG